MASPRVLSLLAVAALGCGPNNIVDPPPPRSTTAGVSGGTVGVFSSGTTGSSGSQGANSLDGPLGFTPQNALAEGTTTALITVELTNGDPGCSENAAYSVVRITLPSSGNPGVGTVSVDAGATIELLGGAPGQLAIVDSASRGQVTLNDVESSTLGGNFSAEMMTPDGGDSGALSGIFSAAVCN